MCGRYTLTIDYRVLEKELRVEKPSITYSPRYNIAPGQNIPVIMENAGTRAVVEMYWGLIPGWSKDKSLGFRMINARAETVAEKPAFRNSFNRRRCLIPADGFFEWKQEDGSKYPLRIILPDKNILTFAGIWDCWISPAGEKTMSCSIITTEPNGFMQRIHHRMPVILAKKEQQAEWLWPLSAADELRSLLRPYDGLMDAYRVPDIVNSPKNDVFQCVQKLN